MTQRLVLGIGLRPGVRPEALAETVELCLGKADGAEVGAIGTLESRADHPALVAMAARLGVPVTGLSSDRLALQPVGDPSSRVADAVGTPSVAEAAVLALGGDLLVPKTAGDGVTVAVGRLPDLLIQAAVAALGEVATFDSAGVADKG